MGFSSVTFFLLRCPTTTLPLYNMVVPCCLQECFPVSKASLEARKPYKSALKSLFRVITETISSLRCLMGFFCGFSLFFSFGFPFWFGVFIVN